MFTTFMKEQMDSMKFKAVFWFFLREREMNIESCGAVIMAQKKDTLYRHNPFYLYNKTQYLHRMVKGWGKKLAHFLVVATCVRTEWERKKR